MHPEVTVCVQSGRHKGAKVALDQKTYTAGRSPDCDIVLFEPSLADRHCRLDVEENAIIITALDGGITIPGKGEIGPGFRTKLQGPTAIEIGDVKLDLQVEAPQPRQFPTMILAGGLAGLGAVVVIGLSLFAPSEAPTNPSWQASTAQSSDASSGVAQQAASLAPEKPEKVDYAAISAKVAQELARRGLAKVSLEHSDSMLTLAGQIEATKLTEFRSFQRWFDESFPGTVLRANLVTVKVAKKVDVRPPVIQSVWHVGTPYIVVGDERYYRNDVLPNGWQLSRINVNYAEFTFGGELYRVQLAPEDEAEQLALK